MLSHHSFFLFNSILIALEAFACLLISARSLFYWIPLMVRSRWVRREKDGPCRQTSAKPALVKNALKASQTQVARS